MHDARKGRPAHIHMQETVRLGRSYHIIEFAALTYLLIQNLERDVKECTKHSVPDEFVEALDKVVE